MEKKSVAVTGPIAIAGISLILVTRLSASCQSSGGNIFFSGIKQPVRIVVASPHAKQAFDARGGKVSLDELVREFPHLAGALETTARGQE
jgi:hypothetical protein